MKFAMTVNPLPLPGILCHQTGLKLLLGTSLFLFGVLVFSMWKDKVFSLKDEDRARFLMFHPVGGTWLLAVFAVCSGIYFLFDSIFKFHS